METKTNTLLAELFMKELRKGTDNFSPIYFSLFSIKELEDLNDTLEYVFELSEGKDSYFKASGKKDWFYIWHKSVRQGDFFNDCYKKVNVPLLDKKESSEYKFLKHKVHQAGYNKRGEEDELFTPEYKRYLELWTLKRREDKDESINGHLDSMLWNLVHADGDILYNAFMRTFTEYKLTNKSKKIKLLR